MTELSSCSYSVRRQTAFYWEKDGDSDRTDHLERAAAAMQRRLQTACPHYEPMVRVVSVRGRPQLDFGFVITATSEAAALTKADWQLRKAAHMKLYTGTRRLGGRPERAKLTLVWDEWRVAEEETRAAG